MKTNIRRRDLLGNTLAAGLLGPLTSSAAGIESAPPAPPKPTRIFAKLPLRTRWFADHLKPLNQALGFQPAHLALVPGSSRWH